MSGTIFITGTDTGVGKTLLTALLLRHLREEGCAALAMKPFCSGPRDDAKLLHTLQKGSASLAETNPFYFREPVAPWVAAKKGRQIPLKAVLSQIHAQKKRSKTLLIEGSGGLLVPLGEGYMVADLISKLQCRAILVARNRLGTINHTLMSVKVMQSFGIKEFMIVMMNDKKPDFSAKTNRKTLQINLPNTPIFVLPHLGHKAASLGGVKKHQRKLKKILAQILQPVNFTAFFPNRGRKG